MQLMLISHDRNTIRALKIALSKTMEDILPVTSAYSREQAVSQLKKEPAGLIVCDADMPGNEGIEILTGMKAGTLNEDGKYEKDTINYLVSEKLKDYAMKSKKFNV